MAKKITAAQQELLNDIVGQKELADHFGVTRATMDMRIKRSADFPAPVLRLAAGRFYRLSEVQAWSEK